MLYQIANVFFWTFHGVLILFNVFGWLWKSLRRINLICLGLTAGSWFILGIWYGWGYCVCTDWHYRVLRELGHSDLPRSYINYIIRTLTGRTWDPIRVDTMVVIVFFIAVTGSVSLNCRDFFRRRRRRGNALSR